jgi:shikimate dehydrogenase
MKFAVIGHPVAHSISPAIHAAAYAAAGMAHEYVAIDCPDEAAVARVVLDVRTGELAGANVTLPWKRVALALADEVDGSAVDTGAANVLVRRGEKVVAFNTDATALAQELERGLREHGTSAASGVACILGTGGAALAAVVACRRAGFARIALTGRAWSAAADPASWPRVDEFRRLGATPLAWPSAAGDDAFLETCAAANCIVNATSAGMHGGSDGEALSQLVDWARTSDSCFAYDVVYNPPVTPFLARATSAGRDARGGLGMLVGQAAEAFTLWLGVPAPKSEMSRAATHALFGAAPGSRGSTPR